MHFILLNLRQTLQCHIVLDHFRPSEHHVVWQQMQFEIEIELKKPAATLRVYFWDTEIIMQQVHFPLKKSHNLAELNLTLVFPS